MIAVCCCVAVSQSVATLTVSPVKSAPILLAQLDVLVIVLLSSTSVPLVSQATVLVQSVLVMVHASLGAGHVDVSKATKVLLATIVMGCTCV